MKILFLRWLKFNAVGGLGVFVQLGALALLVGVVGVNYLVATGIAVELTVVHNFLWHEYFTWGDRTQSAGGGLFRRLLTFNASNGLVSLVGNLLLMRLLVGVAGVPYVMANGIAILSCSLVNFLLAELMVFVGRQRCYAHGGTALRARGQDDRTKKSNTPLKPKEGLNGAPRKQELSSRGQIQALDGRGAPGVIKFHL